MENKYPKLSLKDITQGLKLSSKEILEYKEIVDKLNKIAEENPEYIDYLRERYPKSNPRLSELRYKMDQMLSASNQYTETHFPENQKLFKKVQQSIKKNIELTDPKNFKNVKDPLTHKKLLSIKYVSNNEVPKKKLKLQNRNKKTAARFFKKPRIKTSHELIDEKIAYLENELKKFENS